MIRPIEGIPTLTGRAARWFVDYMKNSRPDPAKAERARRDREEVRRHIRPLRADADNAVAFMEALAQNVSDWMGGFCSVDIPSPPCAPECMEALKADPWLGADYLAVRWHPEDGFDYQLGIGGEGEMDRRHVTREKAVAVLAQALRWVGGEAGGQNSEERRRG